MLYVLTELFLPAKLVTKKILHAGYTIYRKDRANRCGGGVLIAIKTFKSIKEFQSNIEELLSTEV